MLNTPNTYINEPYLYFVKKIVQKLFFRNLEINIWNICFHYYRTFKTIILFSGDDAELIKPFKNTMRKVVILIFWTCNNFSFSHDKKKYSHSSLEKLKLNQPLDSDWVVPLITFNRKYY